MTQIPAGWYPDPAQTHPARQRYWDGTQWTEHVHDPEPPPPTPPAPTYPPPPAYPSHPSYPQGTASPGYYPSAYQPAGTQPGAYEPLPAYGQPFQKQRPTTPDGVPLSGWWWRVLATLLDGLISIPLYLLAVVPVLAWQWDALSNWFSALSDAMENNTPNPPEPALLDPSTGPGFVLITSVLAASVIYQVVFLRWKQATPGKLIVGLRIRRREVPGSLPWATILARVGFVTTLGLLAQVPVAGLLFGLVQLLDYLWPLWDSKNQALHDKVARTNVVRPDRDRTVTEAGLPPRW